MKFHLFKYLVVISLFLVSCSNEFELTEQGEVVPVVYGVISAQNTALYIRVEKSFVSETVSGNELALDPKNLYYDDIQVMLKHTKTGKDFTLRRVDGNKEGYQRDQTGVFANSPNYLYKIKRSEINLIPSDEYQIILDTSGINVKGTVHWVSVKHGVHAEVRLYDRLFKVEDPADEEGDFKEYLNPGSLQVLPVVFAEPALKDAILNERYQFIRKGYFVADKDASHGNLIFNKTVGLKDGWAKEVKKN